MLFTLNENHYTLLGRGGGQTILEIVGNRSQETLSSLSTNDERTGNSNTMSTDDNDVHPPRGSGWLSQLSQATLHVLEGREKRRASRKVSDIWKRTWFALNELAGHATLVIAIMLLMAIFHWGNHFFLNGYVLVIPGLPQVSLDEFFTAFDVGALSRLAWAGLKIFRNL
jgi:hypothetical protein